VRITVIGLGVMGLPMSINLVKAGHEVVGMTRTASRGRPLAEAGGRLVETIAEAVAGAEAVVTMLPDSPDVEQVYRQPGGIFESAPAGALLIDMSTIRPLTARGLYARAAAAGMAMVDAPVSGGQAGAEQAALSIMCGGDQPAYERALPVLQALGTTIVHVGAAGSGQTVKAANQLLVAGAIELVSEALVFLDQQDVDLQKAVEVLRGGLAGNAILERKAASMIAGQFQPGFRIDLHHKDLGIFMDTAREIGTFSPLGALAAQLMVSMRGAGDGGLDHTALLRGVARLSGSDNPKWGTA
jgi:2-hydroxy-3-oxopropionate reductase